MIPFAIANLDVAACIVAAMVVGIVYVLTRPKKKLPYVEAMEETPRGRKKVGWR